MKIITKTLILTVCLLVWTISATAGEQRLTVRLVTASNESGNNAGLEDVIVALKENLPYRSYTLVDTGRAKLPATESICKLGEYTIIFNGDHKNLTVGILKGRKELLNTTISVSKKSPLIVGGFSEGNKKIVFVLTLD